jgi:hypothetical protein
MRECPVADPVSGLFFSEHGTKAEKGWKGFDWGIRIVSTSWIPA